MLLGPRRRGTTLVRVKRRAKEAEGRKPVFSEELRSDLAHGCRDGRVQALRANDNMLRRTMTVQDAHIGSHIRNKQACAAPCRRLRTHHPRCGIGAAFERGDMCAYCYTWVEKLEQQAQALIRDMKEALVALAPTFWDAWLAKGNAWEPHQVDDARWVHKLFPP